MHHGTRRKLVMLTFCSHSTYPPYSLTCFEGNKRVSLTFCFPLGVFHSHFQCETKCSSGQKPFPLPPRRSRSTTWPSCLHATTAVCPSLSSSPQYPRQDYYVLRLFQPFLPIFAIAVSLLHPQLTAGTTRSGNHVLYASLHSRARHVEYKFSYHNSLRK